ncbi:MAG: hypothetical protein LUP92_04435, partial [Methanomicrobiales archaeon]|nr:hypothetical protein [Methanomicrobiales archaeon]
ALILLSDGDYNHYGDPFARGTSTTSTSSADYDDLVTKYYRFSDLGGSGQWSLQNMSIYAKSYNVKIYSIGFAKSLTTGGRDTLKGLAEQTGGSYYDADATNIADVYTAIAGSLKDTAGVNTTLLLSFKNVNVTTNDVTTLTPGDQVYNYTHIDGQSTRIDYGNSSGSYPTYPRSFDNTTEWQTSQKFDFTIGTVRLGEYWKSTVTLQVLKEGTISVFDSSSNVTTQDGAVKQNLKIPDAYIVALPNLSAAALTGMATLTIDELDLTNEGSVTSADLQWNLSYDGMYDISEDLMISEYGYTRWDHMPPLQVSNATPIYDTGSIPITSLAYGYYTIRLEVEAYDSNPAARELTIYISEAGVRELHPGEVPVPGAGAVPTQKARIKIS